MQSKLLAFVRREQMLQPGDQVICAVSGGADSMALLWCLYRLQDKLGIVLEAAHFNHGLRGEESDRDEAFVRDFCKKHGITCHVGRETVVSGPKGLEAAARMARYGFLYSLPGKIATAHTADDNAETVFLHLVRGTGLKGLGGITPKTERLIRPMLTVTRQEVLAFLEAEQIPYVSDSSNDTDDFLRNRIRHHVLPLLRQENPSLAENLSGMALGLRQDEKALGALAVPSTNVEVLRNMEPALQIRVFSKLLADWGVPEPERQHLELLGKLVTSENPSAVGHFPGNIRIGRQYGELAKLEDGKNLPEVALKQPGTTVIPQWGLTVTCAPADADADGWHIRTEGRLTLRSRREGDSIVLPGGTKSLKKLFIDRKIPAARRHCIPVIADEKGIVGVLGIGPSRDRLENPDTVITVTKSAFAEE